MNRIVGNGPDLALIHGWGLSSAIWQPLLDALARSCRVHRVDLPGYAGSACDPAGFAATARRLLDALPAPVVLCGWSLVAALAMHATLHAPHRVAGLVLVAATPCFVQRDDWRTAQPLELLDGFAASVEQQAEPTLRRFIALLCQGDRQARSIARGLLAGLRQGPLPTTAALVRGLDWLRTVDLRQSLPMITVDTLLIHGDQDPLNPLAAARWLSARLPHGRLEVFAGAAHAPFFADRYRFVDLLDDFCHARTAA